MPTLSELVTKISNVVGIPLSASDYVGFLSKRLTVSSSIAVEKAGRGYHIEVTNAAQEMLLFPVVTSSKYETAPESAEKRRYYLRLDLSLCKSNLLTLLERTLGRPEKRSKPKSYFDAEISRVGALPEVIRSHAHCTFQIRATGQRQFEIGTSSDGQDFIALRSSLWPDDYLIFLQRGAACYDVFGLPKELMGSEDWQGWEVSDDGSASQVVGAGNVVGTAEASAAYGPVSDDLGPETETKIAEVVSVAQRFGSNSIIALAGAPGTGKSFIASIAAARLAGTPERVREIQFHGSFGYEEFVEGLRIVEGGRVAEVPGVFLEINAQALKDPDNIYLLLIEEFTRANVSSVLGELLTFVEHRERAFITAYSKRSVFVAKNLRILATYNPLDRSAIEMDAALIRRLRIIDFPPSVTQLDEMLTRQRIPKHVIAALKTMFEACLAREDAVDMMPFGHGVFSGIQSEAPDLYELWMERIRHFLYRPGLSPNQFADVIRANYPWREGPTFTLPKPADSVTSAAVPSATEALAVEQSRSSVVRTLESPPTSIESDQGTDSSNS